MAAAREAVGPDVTIALDVNCYWDRIEDVVAFCRAAARYDIAWLEEPLYPVDQYDKLADLRSKIGVPIAIGENFSNVNELRSLDRVADIVQSSAPKIGGVSGVLEAMQILREKGGRVIPHSPFTGPALAATIHIIAALQGESLCEHRFCDLEASPIGPCILTTNGFIDVPNGRGPLASMST